MTHRPSQFKTEVRILGLDTCRKNAVLGAIVRGGSYLDGILNLSDSAMQGHAMADHILKSKYYPELRIIMCHDPHGRIDAPELSKETQLPWVEVEKRTNTKRKSGFTKFARNGRRVYARSNLPPQSLAQLIRLSWTFRDLPEPVRVAHLLAMSMSRGVSAR